MTTSIFEFLVCVFAASCLLIGYANVRIVFRMRRLQRDDTRNLPLGERAGRNFSRNTRWMTDPLFRAERRLLIYALLAAVTSISLMLVTGAVTGQLKFAV
ncbi:hypothetical protein [Neorhizobium vignae]|uniref:hypothetical protein n=1 Tax=Neorhizobium vignae TaxID=690585 RepID=UPI00056CAA63|nr:hypothetical protein [Neorhizobium vignae]